jgi:purine catabolism regulator
VSITVREALEIPSFKNAKVISGHQGLNNIIRFVNVMEVAKIAKWLKGGELLITTGFPLKDDANIRRRIIYDLAEKGVAALGIKLGHYLEEIPADLVEYTSKVELPLIELDPDVPYSEIMIPLFEILLNEQLCRLKRSETIHNKVLEALLTGNGMASICETLADIENNPVFITDKVGNILANAVPGLIKPQLNTSWQNGVLESLKDSRIQLFSLNPHRWHRVVLQLNGSAQDVIIIPIKIHGDLSGNLVIIEWSGQLDEFELMSMEHASTIIALEFAKEKALLETECQIRGELLEDLISGHFKNEEEMIRRASHIKFNLNSSLVVFVIGLEGVENGRAALGKTDEKQLQKIKTETFNLTHSAFKDYPNGAMLLCRTDGITGLVRQSAKDEKDILAKKLAEIAKKITVKLPGLNFSIGLGRAYSGIRNIKRSYEEAVAAVRIGSLNRTAGPIRFEALGPYRFLFQLKDSMDMKMYYDEYLGKIIAYDQENNSALLNTLICYFNHDCSLNRTAESLYIHKNSVIYRMKKIEEITGLSVNNADECFNLQLCLKLGQLIEM